MLPLQKNLLILCCVFSISANAQRRPVATITTTTSHLFPVRAISESMNPGTGFSAKVMFRIHKNPWYIGSGYFFNDHGITVKPIDYSDNGIVVKATSDAHNRSHMVNLFLRREFLIKTHPGFLPYIEGGIGAVFFNTHFRVWSEREEPYTDVVAITETETVPNPDYDGDDGDYDNCVPNDSDPEYITITTVTGYDTVSGIRAVRTYHEKRDILKDNTFYGFIGMGINLGLIRWGGTKREDGINFLNAGPGDEPAEPYEEPMGLFLHVSGGIMFGGLLSHLNLDRFDPNTDECIHGKSADIQPYSVDFINLKTSSVHPHQVGSIYTSMFKAVYLQAGLTFKF